MSFFDSDFSREEVFDSGSRGNKSRVESLVYISLDDSAVRSCGNDLCHVNAGFECKVTRSGRDKYSISVLFLCCAFGFCLGSFCACFGNVSVFRIVIGFQKSGNVLAFFAYNADRVKTGYYVSFFREDGKNSARCLRRFIKGAFIRFIREKDIADFDMVAFFLMPRRYYARFNALTLAGHTDYVCHVAVQFLSCRDVCLN